MKIKNNEEQEEQVSNIQHERPGKDLPPSRPPPKPPDFTTINDSLNETQLNPDLNESRLEKSLSKIDFENEDKEENSNILEQHMEETNKGNKDDNDDMDYSDEDINVKNVHGKSKAVSIFTTMKIFHKEHPFKKITNKVYE